MINRVTPDHFGTDIRGSAHRVDGAFACQFRKLEVRLRGKAGETEIHHFQRFLRGPWALHHQVRWFQVAVNDASRMRGLQGMRPVMSSGPPTTSRNFSN